MIGLFSLPTGFSSRVACIRYYSTALYCMSSVYDRRYKIGPSCNIIMLTSSSSSSINCNNLTNADNEIVSFILWPRNIERDIEKITGHWDPLLSMISEGEQLSALVSRQHFPMKQLIQPLTTRENFWEKYYFDDGLQQRLTICLKCFNLLVVLKPHNQRK